MSGWIKFSDQLPEFSKRVLIMRERTGHIEDATIYESEEVEGEWYHVLFDGEMISDPTHWQPLPAPPEVTDDPTL